MTSVKIGLSVFILGGISSSPAVFALMIGQALPGLFYYFIFLNNVGNIVVYLFVDKKFRAALKSMCGRN